MNGANRLKRNALSTKITHEQQLNNNNKEILLRRCEGLTTLFYITLTIKIRDRIIFLFFVQKSP
jgi:hypothetical protein